MLYQWAAPPPPTPTTYIYLGQKGCAFGRLVLFVYPSARPSNYLKSNERICMKF